MGKLVIIDKGGRLQMLRKRQARRIVEQKNSDEIVQSFIAHTSGIDYKTKSHPNIQAPVSKEKAKGHASTGESVNLFIHTNVDTV